MNVSADGLVLSAPLSLVQQLKTTEDTPPADNIRKMNTMDAPVPLHQLKRAANSESVKTAKLSPQEKVTTRQKLLCLNQSLNVLIRYKFADSQPPVVLRPPVAGEQRCTVEHEGLMLSYYWNGDSKESTWQCTRHPQFADVLRLSVLADEGDTGPSFQLASAGLAVLLHRDTLHKLHREEALSSDAVPAVRLAKHQVGLICKYNRAPWKTSAFGRRVSEAMDRVHEVPENHILLDQVAVGVAADRGLPPSFTMKQIKDELVAIARECGRSTGAEHKTGRWCDFIDSFDSLKKHWHGKLFFLMWALLLEGVNPLHTLSDALASQGQDDDKALLPKVLRAFWLHVGRILSYGCACAKSYNPCGTSVKLAVPAKALCSQTLCQQ